MKFLKAGTPMKSQTRLEGAMQERASDRKSFLAVLGVSKSLVVPIVDGRIKTSGLPTSTLLRKKPLCYMKVCHMLMPVSWQERGTCCVPLLVLPIIILLPYNLPSMEGRNSALLTWTDNLIGSIYPFCQHMSLPCHPQREIC